MEPAARSLLLELMAKSKKGLSYAEQLCSQAREELHACQGHSDEIEKIYSKLCFVSGQIKVQIMTVESLLRIARSRLNELSKVSKDLQNDLKNVSIRMEHALRALRDKKVDSEIQKPAQRNTTSLSPSSSTSISVEDPGAITLFDFLDEVNLLRLQKESSERMKRIQLTTNRLHELVQYFSEQRTEFRSYLNSAITLDESALSFAREKMQLQEHHTTSMAESLVSLANHYDQVANVLTADIQPTHEELDVLESDTALMLVIIEELEESLALVQATSEEVGVREHLYTTAYQEAIAVFKKIESLEPDLIELLETFKTAESMEDEFSETEGLISEIVSLATWYEEFYNSYSALTVEILRRHQVHQAQQGLVRDLIEKLKSSYIDEMKNRTEFADRHGKYLPVDLCPTIADHPMQYEVLAHGEWRLPMLTRATLQTLEDSTRYKQSPK